MPISVAELDIIAEQVSAGADLRAGVAAARARFPGLSFTCCEAFDLGGDTPFRSYAGFDLHLVDGSGHCWQLTGDPGSATGVLLAERRAARR